MTKKEREMYYEGLIMGGLILGAIMFYIGFSIGDCPTCEECENQITDEYRADLKEAFGDNFTELYWAGDKEGLITFVIHEYAPEFYPCYRGWGIKDCEYYIRNKNRQESK